MLDSLEAVLELANGEPNSRDFLETYEVKNEIAKLLRQIEELSDLTYALTYLEAKLHCDEFMQAKNNFKDLGETYGYVTSYVSLDKNSISTRFQYRRPIPGGGFSRDNIRPTAKGYTLKSFSKAAHDTEKEFCMATEDEYRPIRHRAKQIKAAMRTLRTTDIYKELPELEEELDE